MALALNDSFKTFQNPEFGSYGDAAGYISDTDKESLKYNIRKQDLFEQAYNFCDELFGIDDLIKTVTP